MYNHTSADYYGGIQMLRDGTADRSIKRRSYLEQQSLCLKQQQILEID
jgi:hypothetical protein